MEKLDQMKKAELIFIPLPGIGHLVPILEFAKRILNHNHHISITVFILKFQYSSFIDSYTTSLNNLQPRVRFVNLPELPLPPPELAAKSFAAYLDTAVESYVTHLRDLLGSIVVASSVRVVGLVIDMFYVSMIDVAKELSIPCYIFMTSNAGFLDLLFYLTIRHGKNPRVFEKSDGEILLPGWENPVPVSVLLGELFNPEGGYDTCIKLANGVRDCNGIILNSFVELEKFTVESFSELQVPPVYPVGPVIDLEGLPNPHSDADRRDTIMEWLNEQPESTVVLLCFGSEGGFDSIQVREVALALDQAKCRFLWSMRSKIPEDALPEGFVDRIKDRGMICDCEWLPQVKVLAHRAIGGFVSHCGWNSTLESLWCGVPTLTWPLYAEQQMNVFKMVRELELAVELKLDYKMGGGEIVMADEIARAIGCLMDRDNPVRKRVKDMSEIAKKAVTNGGSSFNYVERLIEDMVGMQGMINKLD